MNIRTHLLKRILLTFSIFGLGIIPTVGLAEVIDITFPVLGGASYSNDFGAPRSGGRSHEGNDLFANKHWPLVAAEDGRVKYVPYPEPSYGYAIFLQGDSGNDYWYLHMNNDTPGTDDGQGGGINAFAPYMVSGSRVTAGQLVGWAGDSGNAEATPSHVHFEIHSPEGEIINPFDSLQAATIINTPVAPPKQKYEILPFNNIPIATSIAAGDIDGDGTEELVVAAGPGGGPQVRIFNEDGELLSQFFAYTKDFTGGVEIALGDIDGDGDKEIITGTGPDAELKVGPQVRVFNHKGKLLNSFMAYERSFTGGIRVAAADLTGNGKAAIVTAPFSNRKPQVRIFRPNGKLAGKFMAYDKEFTNGVYIAAMPQRDDKRNVKRNDKKSTAKIITGAGPGGGPQVRVFNRKGKLRTQFMAYNTSFKGGVNVTAAPIDVDSPAYRIITVPASGGGAQIRVFTSGGTVLSQTSTFEEWWRGGYDLAVSSSQLFVATVSEQRRASIWPLSLSAIR